MLDARERAEAAQTERDADAMREAIRAYRAGVAAVLDAAREAMAAAGFAVTATQSRRMSETLAAASVAGSQARELFAAGWLTRDVEHEDPFAGVASGPVRPRNAAVSARDTGKAAAEVEAAKKRAAHEAARKRAAQDAARQALRERVDALESEAREARLEARRAEMAAAGARTEAERARAALEQVEARLRKAREELRALAPT
jgi:colicin import membrane protein